MWKVDVATIADGRVVKYCIDTHEAMTFDQAVHHWREDQAFREFFVGILRDAPFDAYRWETPPVTQETFDREFEFVLIDCPQLARSVDRAAFDVFFSAAEPGEPAITFENLGRDATLVVPCPPRDEPSADLSHFAHLASFVRNADDQQVDAFWQLVGQTMSEHVGDKPTWLSTAGMGVAWLHVRLDQRPKYYAHAPYREERP